MGFYVGLAIIVLLMAAVGWFVLRLRARHRAASNVLFAKYSWLRLDKQGQQQVHECAVQLATAGGRGTRGFANEVEQFGWYALAMAELGVVSSVPGNPEWHRVNNPYTVLNPYDPVLGAIAGMMKTEIGVNVSVNVDAKYSN